MANFKIDGVDYDTEKLDTKQKRVIALYQQLSEYRFVINGSALLYSITISDDVP